MNSKTKIFVFGIDGASWNVLDRVIKLGWMPTLSSLAARCGKGALESSTPPQTIPAWVNFSTGTNPGKHSCYGLRHHKSYDEFELVSSSDCKVKPFYAHLDDAGKRCVLINLPGSFPPDLKHGVSLASFLDRMDHLYYPSSLINKVPEVKDYKVFPDYLSSNLRLVDIVEEFINLERGRFSIAKKLFEREWDFFFYMISSYDFLLHKLGYRKKLDEVLQVRGVRTFFKEIDEQLRWFLERSNNLAFFLMSDHGFREYEYVFYINTWLEKEGHLKLKSKRYKTLGDLPPRITLVRLDAQQSSPLVAGLFGLFNKLPLLYGWAGRLIRVFPNAFPRLAERRLGDWGLAVDEDETKVFATNEFFLMSRLGGAELADLVGKLRALRLPQTQKPVFSKVCSSSEVYEGPFVKHTSAPAVVLDLHTALVDYALWSKEIFVRRRNIHHRSEGVFLGFGPGISLGKNLRVKIEDLAPTFLKLFNQRTPEYMAGEPLV